MCSTSRKLHSSETQPVCEYDALPVYLLSSTWVYMKHQRQTANRIYGNLHKLTARIGEGHLTQEGSFSLIFP